EVAEEAAAEPEAEVAEEPVAVEEPVAEEAAVEEPAADEALVDEGVAPELAPVAAFAAPMVADAGESSLGDAGDAGIGDAFSHETIGEAPAGDATVMPITVWSAESGTDLRDRSAAIQAQFSDDPAAAVGQA